MSIKEQIRAEIERQKEINKRLLDGQLREGCLYAFNQVLSFLDTLPEQEHPIYALNQILLDWMREAKTDKEQEARFEAYKRFFELYDEHMVQEPEQPMNIPSAGSGAVSTTPPKFKLEVKEQPASEGLEEEIKRMVYDVVYDLDGPAIMGTSEYLSVEDIAYIARHFAEWGAEHLKK